jgi:hypothetical protein
VGATSTVRIAPEVKAELHEIAREDGLSLSDALAKLIKEARIERLMARHNSVYAALRVDPQAWEEIEAERALWDSTLADGLDEPY